jgi:hypothetical protein
MFDRRALFDESPGSNQLSVHDLAAALSRALLKLLMFRQASRRFTRPRSVGRVLERYATKYPFQVNWRDHRPIGAIFLASSGINIATNPRRWIMNSGKIDITSNEGKARFRGALLSLADKSIKVLKDANAQGMITWDQEGEEFLD